MKRIKSNIFFIVIAFVAMYIILSCNNRNRSAQPAGDIVYNTPYTQEREVATKAGNNQQKDSGNISKKTVTARPKLLLNATPRKYSAWLASEAQGIIGRYNGLETDNPADNIFSVTIDKPLQATDRVWLNYQLTGIDHHAGTTCSVNDRLAFGGYLACTDTSTSRQRVEINPAWLTNGRNSIRFGLPGGAVHGFKVSNLAIEIEQDADNIQMLALDATHNLYDGKVWLHGFVRDGKKVTVKAGNIALQLHDNEFETVLTPDADSLMVKAEIDGHIYTRILKFRDNRKADYACNFEQGELQRTKLFKQNKPGDITSELSYLKAPAKTVLATRSISVTDLRSIDLPALDLGMTNVTANNRGVRYLPHGQHFTGEGATVALKYDRTKIPDGYTENDIRTYYFDPRTKHWVALERDTVDKSLCMVVSKTTHFTDMINGVITTPESPETQGFAPTMMNDIKAADPTSKIELIAPPTANNQGSANLSYPIELPPARNGMSPNLAISYNSDGGSGWLGEGWDLQIPSITVDTRFGVPTYDPLKETETYSMGGDILARAYVSGSGNNDQIDEQMFFPDRGVVFLRNKINNGGNKYQFYPRIEGDFSQIIRIGTNPFDYSWEVTDKSGTKYYYGGSGADLKDPVSGNIAEWKLKAMVNIYGDSVSYSYRPNTETVYSNLQASSLYLDKIEAYTRDNNLNKKHTQVLFVSNTKKIKKTNNARYGFIVLNSLLLDSIIINYDSTGTNNALNLLRVYSFGYVPELNKPKAVNADLLESITQKDNTNSIVSIHTLDYHNRVSDNIYYNNPVSQTPAPEVEKNILGLNNSSVFGNTKTTNKSASLYTGIGGYSTPLDLVKLQGTVGLSSSYSKSITNGESTLIDLNGDGLADKVYNLNGEMMFCPQYPVGVYNMANVISISGAPSAFQYSEKESISLGLAGYSVVSGTIDKDLLSKTKTTSYFSDVNGDGLVDVVYNKDVYFNYIAGYINNIAIPAFTLNSSMTDNPMTNETVYNTNPVANGFIDYSNFSEDSLRSEAAPLQDVVRVWEAPYNGEVKFGGYVQLLPPSGDYDTLRYNQADGVRVAIQYKGEEKWYLKINKNENREITTYSWYNSESDTYDYDGSGLEVKKGDRIYFRVQSGDSLLSNDYFDNVLWSPVISYRNYDNNFPNTPDINGYSYTEFPASEALVSKSGYNEIDTVVSKVFISSKFIKSDITKDIVKLTIYASATKSYNENNSIYTKTYNPETITDDTLNFKSISNNTNKYFWFVLSSNSNNVRWDKVSWEPIIRYSYISKDSLINRNDNAGVNYDIYFDQFNDNDYDKNRIIEIPSSGSFFACPIIYYQDMQYSGSYICDQTGSEDDKTFTIKLIDIETNVVALSVDNVKFNSSPYEASPLFFDGNSNIIRGKKYKIEAYLNSLTQINSQKTYGIALYTYKDYLEYNICNSSVLSSITLPTIYSKYNRDKNQEFGLMWRNWGQFEYNAAQERYKFPIDEVNLKLPCDSDNISLGSMRLITLAPDFKTKKYWQGYSDNIKLRGDTMVPARLLLNNLLDIKSFTSVNGPARAPRRKTLIAPSNIIMQNIAVQKPDNPIYHINAPDIESKEPNLVSVSISGNVPIKFLNAIGIETSINGTYANSKYEKQTDYVDMNGDGYPDYFKDGKILYSNSRGTQTNRFLYSKEEQSHSNIYGLSVSAGKQIKQTATSNSAESAKENAAKISASAGVTSTITTLNVSYVDVNGDGLPDKINHDNDSVAINLGYGFSSLGKLTTFANSETNFSANAGLGYGIELGNNFSFGTGYASTYSTKNRKFADINGDGLVDIIEQVTNANWTNVNLLENLTSKRLKVYLNTGNGFSTNAIDWVTDAMNESSMSICKSNNATITFGIPIVAVRIMFNLSGQESTTNSFQLTDIRDYDGDGYPDLLSTSKGSNNLEIKYSKIAYTNKLKSITNPLGGKIELDYKRTEPSSDHPGGKWVMASVVINDGLDDDGKFAKSVFDYFDGKYDRRERQFRGFGEVITENLDSDNGDDVYRRSVQKYDVSNYFAKNNMIKSVITDKNGKIIQEIKNIYSFYNVKTFRYGGTVQLDKYTFNDFQLSDSIVAYSPLRFSENSMYDDSSNKLITSQSYYTYNTNRSDLLKNDLNRYGFGELKSFKYSDKGSLDSIGNGDYNYETIISYKPLKANDKYVHGLPAEMIVKDNAKTYRHIKAYYNHAGFPNHLTRITRILKENGDSAVTTIQYDKAGNILHKLLPSGMAYTYSYDTKYNMYVTQVKDTFGYVSKLENYDYSYGIPLRTTDFTGSVSTTTLDNLGRVVTITGPNEQGTSAPYTIKFEYNPQKIVKSGDDYTQMPYAITKHYDATKASGSDDDKNLETVTFVDGFGRPVQVKKESVVDGQPKMIVSGRVKYDAFGRVTEAYYPVADALAKTTFNPAFGIPAENIDPTKTTYDVLDRVVTTVLPDGATTKMDYSITDGLLLTRVTDANNKYQDTYTTGDGKTVKTVQYKAYDTNGHAIIDSALITRFHYDAINQPDTVTDTKGKKTISIYDLAGRRTQVTHPASGITKFDYNAEGNLIAKQTANMLANNGTKKINYFYTYNRLDSIVYPDHTENNVKYVYGLPSDTGTVKGYRAGRLKYIEDGSGAQEFTYGKMGEVTEVRRTMVIPNQAVATYVTKTAYDSWNRLLKMTYPDGEEVNYTYNTGGMLTGVASTANTYISNIKYDKFEQRTYLKYGNGKETNYTYDEENRQLKNLKVGVGESYIMNNTYGYDLVGNILSVENNGTTANNLGGIMKHYYKYDNLYRLDSADGIFTGANGKTAKYGLKMRYDNMHNITRKTQHIEQFGVQFKGTLRAGYDLLYQYADNSQQIANIAEESYRADSNFTIVPEKKASQYSYDANGNLLCINTGNKAGDKLLATNNRTMLWDEENRLLALSDNGFVSNYWYNAAGERTVKMSGDGEGVNINGVVSAARTGTTNFTAYINPYLVVRNGGEYTKHIYMGSQRITSKVSNSGIFSTSPVKDTLQAKYATQTATLKSRYDSLGVSYKGIAKSGSLISNAPTTASSSYFYHSDHLGSSSLITDLNGEIVQHLEYVPFGDTFIDERRSASSWTTPYLFSGKQRDEETGLIYFGARYYDPKTSVWLSVDPLAEKYPNISSYVYCADNPIIYTDPDGRTFYYSSDGKFVGEYGPKNTDVYTIQAGKYKQDTKEHKLYFDSKDATQLKFSDGTSMTHDQFKDLAGTLYAEATKGKNGSWEESASIYSVLENRANDQNTTTYEQAQTGGVNGWKHKGDINKKTANGDDVKNAYEGLIRGILDNKDYSNGAYYWDGTDYSTTDRYTNGTVFTEKSHNIWSLKDNAKAGKNIYGSWDSKFETTNAVGNTTFSRCTQQWLNTRYRAGVKVDYKGEKKK